MNRTDREAVAGRLAEILETRVRHTRGTTTLDLPDGTRIVLLGAVAGRTVQVLRPGRAMTVLGPFSGPGWFEAAIQATTAAVLEDRDRDCSEED